MSFPYPDYIRYNHGSQATNVLNGHESNPIGDQELLFVPRCHNCGTPPTAQQLSRQIPQQRTQCSAGRVGELSHITSPFSSALRATKAASIPSRAFSRIP